MNPRLRPRLDVQPLQVAVVYLGRRHRQDVRRLALRLGLLERGVSPESWREPFVDVLGVDGDVSPSGDRHSICRTQEWVKAIPTHIGVLNKYALHWIMRVHNPVDSPLVASSLMAALTPQAFVEKWSKSTLSERSASQQHFIDLCHMLGQKTPAEADPEGSFYTFEKSVRKSGGTPDEAAGGKGFADVWYRGHFAWEYKGKHRDLSAAYRQLQLYREDLENPPLLVVSDMNRYEVHTNFTGTVKKVYSFTNDEIPKPENLEILRALFEDPNALRPGRTTQSVTEEVAAKFAQIADGLRSRGEDPQTSARFLNKLLFCLFAEDVGLLPEKLFTKLAERTRRDPERFTRYATELFRAMAEGGDFLLEDIPYFDGGLFVGEEAVRLEPKEISILFEAAKLDWGSVEPAIFGTLFERSLDPSRRSQLGAHYTSLEDILTIVEPVLMAPLRREWDAVQEEVEALREKLAGAASARARNNVLRQMEGRILGFAQKIRRVRVLDPACGSGNFLYVSLKQLLDLEKEVSTFAGKVGLTPFFPEVSPEQLHGIELSPYAHELAQVSIWIGYLQWMVENGFGTRQEPILGPMTNILEMDAILERGEDGKLREPEWPEADVIIGNPPFLGGKKRPKRVTHSPRTTGETWTYTPSFRC